MTRNLVRILAPLAFLAFAGCTSVDHLGYDYGRTYTDTFTRQADLTRPSVANRQYVLYGIEAVKIRVLVQEASTEAQEASASE
jgi:hypothetical protein